MSETVSPDRSALPTQSVRAESLLSAPDSGAVAVRPSTRPLVPRKRTSRKAPKDSKIYKAVMAYIALRAQGMKTPEIAEQLGLAPHSVRQYIYYANQRGWLNINSLAQPEDKVDIVLASKAVRNISNVLDETVSENPEDPEAKRVLTNRAVDMSLEVAKGVGLLKQHQIVKSDGGAPNVFALKVEVINPGVGQPVVTLREGSFGGVPAFDAEVVEGETV